MGDSVGVKYIGKDAVYEDNILRTGLSWEKGEVHVLPTVMAKEFLKHPTVFQETAGGWPVLSSPSGSGIPRPAAGVAVQTKATIGQAIRSAFFLAPEHDELILAMGDSTGNETAEWIYLYAAQLATALPSNVRVLYRLYDDAANRYGAPVVLSEGSGSDPYVTVGTDSRGWAFLGTDVGVVGTDLDVRVECALTSYTGTSEKVLCCQYGNAGSRSFRMYLNSGGFLGLEWKTDGTNGPAATLSTVATGLAPGARKWLRATLDTDNGASGYDLKFYLSDDGLTWTQLGTTITGGATTSLHQTTGQVYEVGSRGGSAAGAGAVGGAVGTFYRAHVSGIIDGGNKLPIFLRSAIEYSSGMLGVRGGGPCLEIRNGSISGSRMSYQLTAPRTDRMVPRHIGAAGVLLNSLHNEGPEYKPSAYLADLAALKAAIEARITAPRYALCTQNPQFSPRSSTAIYGQAARARLAESVAQGYGWDVIRSFELLNDPTLINTDGIHPLPAGSVIQANEAWAVCGI